MGRGGGAQKFFLGADLADFRYNYVIICIFTGVVDVFLSLSLSNFGLSRALLAKARYVAFWGAPPADCDLKDDS